MSSSVRDRRNAAPLSPSLLEALSNRALEVRSLSLVHEIEEEMAAQRSRTGSQTLGVAAILGQHPHDRPKHSKRSPAPLFHAMSVTVRRELWEAYAWFVAAFRDASEKLRAGDRSAVFPAGSFPPALPFAGG